MTPGEADDIAQEVVDAFAALYPRLALPSDVWTNLKEMIRRELRFRDGDLPEGARGVAADPSYIRSAIASGLRRKNGDNGC